jgi:putative ABC transport system permease protein
MSGFELLRLALSRLRTSRLRAALTMLGVIIGVASVVALVGVGQGTTADITSSLDDLGTNLLTVNPSTQDSALTLEDAEAIAAVEGVAAVAPESSTSQTVTAGEESVSTTIVGTSPAYAEVRAYDLWQGTFLTEPSVELGLRVAVLGATTAESLGLDGDDLGTEIRIAGLPFTIIGILQPKMDRDSSTPTTR